MIILTENTVDRWDVPASRLSRVVAELVQEKGSGAALFVYILLLPVLLGMGMLAGGFFEQNLKLGLAGAGVLGALSFMVWGMDKLAGPFFEARSVAIDAYLETLPVERVIAQATHLGPGRLGREFLFQHLDKRETKWSETHLAELVALVRAEELPRNQASFVRYHLDERHPGWSGAGRVAQDNMIA